MAIRDVQPMPFVPAGLSDSLDGNMSKKGGMLSCSNLMPSITTPGMFIPRPAAFKAIDFTLGGFTTPGYVSCMTQVGTRVWGMIASGRNTGNDEPFCYDLATSSFVTISGITAGNTPTSPKTSGAWTPPTICAVGGYIVFTHPGYNGVGANFFGVISGAGGNSPAYNSYNTGTNPLPSVPTFCANFNGRVYFACGNTAYFTDVLVPTNMANATNSLTFGGADAITSMSPQPYYTTTAGGIAQALLVFKAFGIWQVQGDLALGTLASNQVISGVGTQSPRSPAVTPNGVAFLAIDGIRTVGLDGQVSVPVGEVNKPFMTALTPTRTACTYNQGTYRAVVDFLQGGSYQKFEYWWDEIREIWTGPHTLTYDNIIPSGASFLVTSPTNTGAIYQTNVLPGATDSFTEFGTQLTFNYQTGVLPEDTSILSEKALIEHTIFMGFATETVLTFNALDPSNNILSTYAVTTPLIAPSGPTTYGVFWPAPIVFNRMSIKISGNSAAGLQLGAMYLHYQALGYINVDFNLSGGLNTSYDYGLVSDPVLVMVGDWGSVADAAVSVVDFETSGPIAGPP
jgi:hypothetical protein